MGNQEKVIKAKTSERKKRFLKDAAYRNVGKIRSKHQTKGMVLARQVEAEVYPYDKIEKLVDEFIRSCE